MNEHLVPELINCCVVKPGNSLAETGPMSEAIALRLTCVPSLVLDHFELQSDPSRLNHALPGGIYHA